MLQLVFQNVGGLIPQTDGELKLTVLKQFIQNNNINIFSFTEHNKCWDLVPKNLQLLEQTKGWWENAHWSLGFNKRELHPSKHQPDGTRLLTVNQTLHPGNNVSGVGCWRWIWLCSQSGQEVLCIISAYWPCVSSGPLSMYQQQVRYLAWTNQMDLPKKLFYMT